MTEQDITRIECELAIVLPADYKDMVLHYPIRADRGTSDSVLFDNASAVIDMNRKYRRGFAGLAAWPQSYYFIGDDGAGNCFFLDLAQEPSPVFFAYKGDIKDVKTEAPTLARFIADYIAGFREADPDTIRTLRLRRR